MFYIHPHLLTDRTWLNKTGDALYVECAYHSLFGISNRYPVLAGDGVHMAGASDLTDPIRHIVRAAWSASLRTGVLFSTADYDTLVTSSYGRRLEGGKRRVFPSDVC